MSGLNSVAARRIAAGVPSSPSAAVADASQLRSSAAGATADPSDKRFTVPFPRDAARWAQTCTPCCCHATRCRFVALAALNMTTSPHWCVHVTSRAVGLPVTGCPQQGRVRSQPPHVSVAVVRRACGSR
jgi:hypothetical protein